MLTGPASTAMVWERRKNCAMAKAGSHAANAPQHKLFGPAGSLGSSAVSALFRLGRSYGNAARPENANDAMRQPPARNQMERMMHRVQWIRLRQFHPIGGMGAMLISAGSKMHHA